MAKSSDSSECVPDASSVELGYVRSMLASLLFTPAKAHSMSAICIELGCRSRITRTRVAGATLLAAGAEGRAPWVPRKAPRRLLVIGLGTSTMALWLQQALPSTELHAVDLSAGVVAAAPCFGLRPASSEGATAGPRLHVGDGRKFLEGRQDGEFDGIIVDAFDSNASLPGCFRTQEFFNLARKKLAPGGALSLNLLNMGLPSLQVLASLESAFAPRSVWVGDAPGAEGIQNVVVAFAPGAAPQQPRATLLARNPPSVAEVEEASGKQAVAWLHRARFRPAHEMAKDNSEGKSLPALVDASLCPSSAGSVAGR